ncbi:hypothetical protein GBAG_3192 [Buttiauxella agrestis ATCC 33320]|uniref:Uncharacterized protein n=1 Tax=Buttiauxella agrestis ATCC 33320 TaxID=1006004 RepID=A0A085G4V1_9ENTR|nr:hypothetical protein GBAG_3192 [Buttiauxella agrestis ATCC 33320]
MIQAGQVSRLKSWLDMQQRYPPFLSDDATLFRPTKSFPPSSFFKKSNHLNFNNKK